MLRVAIADGYSLVGAAICRLLEAEFEISGLVSDGQAAVALAAGTKPDLMLLETELPMMNGFDAAMQIRLGSPKTRIIFVTAQTSRAHLKAAFAAGAIGYVLKQDSAASLLLAIRDAQAGKTFVAPSLERYFLQIQKRGNTGVITLTDLTCRRREVLRLVGEGLTAKEIASKLHISPKTVEFHKKNLMVDLGLRSSTQLVRYFLQETAVPLTMI